LRPCQFRQALPRLHILGTILRLRVCRLLEQLGVKGGRGTGLLPCQISHPPTANATRIQPTTGKVFVQRLLLALVFGLQVCRLRPTDLLKRFRIIAGWRLPKLGQPLLQLGP